MTAPPGVDPRSQPRLPGGPRTLFRGASLNGKAPPDRRLNLVYRIGSGLMGLALIVFGIFGLFSDIGFFDTGDNNVWGLNSNGALSVLSVVVGLILVLGMLKGGQTASNLNLLFGVLFLLSGFFNLAVMETGWNFLDFRMQNVILSFAIGLVLLTFGMYGRVSGQLPHDNPYWRARHPEADREDERRRRLREMRSPELSRCVRDRARDRAVHGTPAGSAHR
ncbi:DUF4383 domain-containing protein [Streptomyces sp. RFCAC02]|uniref:DUF4383 domain-containing protein n=1 Tax=Streptomyces sp. RFCAC02 TaxID=2499143 RepID=UPI00101ECEE4|nr:DUF4383 domain-containing protein [Streptomyces sp. RFCAC02]